MTSSNASPEPFDPGELPYALTQIARLVEGVKAEFDLIAGRMSWLVISESFIFSAFATAAANYRDDHPCTHVLKFLVYVMPFVGMCLAVCVYTAILAGHRAVRRLKDQREQMIACLPPRLQIDLISSRSREQWTGNLPTYVIPPLLFSIWAAALFWAIVWARLTN